MKGMGSLMMHAARSAVRSPRWSALVVVVLTLGIGSTVAVFTVVDQVALRPLPYPAPDELVRIGAVRDGRPGLSSVSGPNFRDLERATTTLTSVAAVASTSMGVTTGTGPSELVRGGWVAGSFFSTLGPEAANGRTLGPADDDPTAPLAVVISHDLAKRRFGETSPIGKTIGLDTQTGTVVGVMDPGFHPPEGVRLGGTEIWAPLAHATLPVEERGLAFLDLLGRIAPGGDPERVATELALIGTGISEAHGLSPRAFGGFGLRPLRDETLGEASETLALLLGAVALLLGLACLNVGTLVLLRTIDRAQALRVRLSLGASRARVVAEVTAETVGLALLGGTAGTLGAWLAVRAISGALPIDLPRLIEAQVDVRVMTLALVLSVAVGLLIGLLPALRVAARTDLGIARSGRGGSASRSMARARDGLVLVQVALGLALAVGAGLLTRSLVRLHAVDPGFDTAGLQVATLRLSGIGGPDFDPVVLDDLLRAAIELPGVTSASLASGAPYTPGGRIGYIQPEGVDLPEETLTQARIELHRASGGHLDQIGLPLVAGRYLTEADLADTEQVVVISQSLADSYWPGQLPLGKRLVVGGDGTFALRTIVGITESPRYRGPGDAPEEHLWLPLRQMPLSPLDLVLRLAPGGPPLESTLAQLGSVDSRVTIRSVRSVEAELQNHYLEPTFFTLLLGGFALIGLLLSAVGLYGTLAHSVRTRRREFGVRLALGASGSGLTRRVVGRGALVTLLGIGAGLTLAWFGTRLLEARLFGVAPRDPLAWIAASALLMAVGLFASWIPARGAGRTSPMTSLRVE